MITILQAAGLSISIYTDDHPPPHVHVYGSGIAKIILAGSSGRPQLAYSKGMKEGDVKKALRIVAENQAVLLQYWSEIYG